MIKAEALPRRRSASFDMDRFIALTCRNRADPAGPAFGSPLVPIAKGFGVFDPHRLFRNKGRRALKQKIEKNRV